MRILILFFALCIVSPGNAALMMSDKKAAAIGKEMYEQITGAQPIYRGEKLNAYVTGVGQRIAAHSDEPEAKYTFTIMDSPEINAFATPGGYIYINRGLLAYLNSEAQLAAVLAHELAHLTARHAVRQKRAQTGSNVVAGVLAVLTRSAEVGEASAMWGAATVKGYGREMELEADAIGAKFLARANYPTEAMIDTISQLKDHERFMKKRAAESGQKVQSYHGLFSSHPRNDKRLREMVKQSGVDQNVGEQNVQPFRLATEGLPWGNSTEAGQQQENRYYDRSLLFYIDYPEGWHFTKQTAQIVGQPADKSASVMIDVKARTIDKPDQFIKKVLGISFIRKSEPFDVAGLTGHTGIVPGKTSDDDERLVVIYYGRGAYLFTGKVTKGKLDDKYLVDTYDGTFKTIATSFRPLRRAVSANRAEIHYVKAVAGATYDKLAQQLQLGRYGADELRLINGHYPASEPVPGQWIKIIR